MSRLLALAAPAALLPAVLLLAPQADVRTDLPAALTFFADASAGTAEDAGVPPPPPADDGLFEIAVDATAGRHRISPLIYGASFATTEQVRDLKLTVNRAGGNSASLYNPDLNARSAGADWFFESVKLGDHIFDQFGDSFIRLTRKGSGSHVMLTMPMIGWQAKLSPDGQRMAGCSILKYGLQQKTDVDGMAEAGNCVDIEGKPIRPDPNDAAMPASLEDRRRWMRDIVRRWGRAREGGVAFWLMDNEPSRWHDIHRAVQPVGIRASELEARVRTFSAMVKGEDPTAKVVAPEEWGWGAYQFSGFDQQNGELGRPGRPERESYMNGMDNLPWLLSRWKTAGKPVDIVSVHFYPQGGEYADEANVSPAMQRMRNRSTRALWDQDYLDPTWINDRVALIPRLRKWVDQYYWPGTPIAITEYAWGAEAHMNGATTQADILGIFGRENLYMANRWVAPKTGSPTYLAMKLFRNPDGRGNGFGDTAVRATAKDADRVSAFAAVRGSDGTLTVMVINKQLDQPAKVALSIAGFAAAGSYTGYQLAGGALTPLAGQGYSGGRLATTVPAQSVTMFVLAPAGDRS